MDNPKAKLKCYFVKRAGQGGRATFALVRKFDDGSTETVKLRELDSINNQYRRGVISHESASAMVEDIKDRLYEQVIAKKYNQENLAVFEDFWELAYAHRDLPSKQVARYELLRAIEAIGGLCLTTASKYELEKAIADHPEQRRIVMRLHQLLKHVQRPNIRLTLNKKKFKTIKHLSPEELDEVLPHIDCEYKEEFTTLCLAAFGTGCRLGELYALTPQSFRGKQTAVFVKEQLYLDMEPGPVKNGKPHLAPIIGPYKRAVIDWVDVDYEIKAEMREWRHGEIFRAACKAAFPRRTTKHCRFHDLRHSYAIEMLNRGVSLTRVAQALGDDIKTAQMYYAGYDMEEEGLETIKHLLK